MLGEYLIYLCLDKSYRDVYVGFILLILWFLGILYVFRFYIFISMNCFYLFVLLN